MSGQLTLAEKDPSRSKLSFFLLTKTHLFYQRDMLTPPHHEAAIRWAIVLPFAEYLERETRFGFSIKYRDEKVDFYTNSEDDLEKWLKGFEMTSLLQDIEDDYSIGQVIGSGGQSIVYSGTDLETGKRVAIKSFDKPLLRESEKRFLALVREIDVLRDLSQPRIVGLYRVYESHSHVQLVMEYISGQELFDSLSLGGAFTEQESRGFMHNLLEVLQYMEEHSVVHRDLKPENIILTDPNDKTQFKLIDFGFATKHTGKELQDTCGSPGYVAPEIILKHQHGPSVDIYSSGIIFYILLCGYSPFYSTKKAEVIKKNAKNEIAFSGIWEQIDPRLVKMIKVMTNFNAKMRMTAPDLINFLSGGPLAVEFFSRRGSVCDQEHLPPLRIHPPTPKTPQISHTKSPGSSTSSKALLQLSKGGQTTGRWPNVRY